MSRPPAGSDVNAPPGASPGPPEDGKPRRSGAVALLRETVVLIVLAVVLAIVFKTFLVQAFYIPSGSMEPTLNIYDRVLVEKLSYRFGDVHRGDVIVFVHDEGFASSAPSNPVSRAFGDFGQALGLVPPTERDFIKRVIGVAGDKITCRSGHVFRNGVQLAEPYLPRGTVTDCEPVTVPPGQLFVMGDNRGNSQDSRVFGPINSSSIVGRAFVRIWPIGRVGWLHRDR